MSRSQREKGAAAEREFAHLLEKFGISARRGQVFNGEPDIVSDSPFHFEVKRQETTKIHEWFRQSEAAAGDKIPVVVHRRNREPWYITLRFEDLMEVLKHDAAAKD